MITTPRIRPGGRASPRYRHARSLLFALGGAGVAFASVSGQVIGTLQSPSALKRMSVEELLKQEVVSVSRRPEPWGETASNVFVVSGQGASMTGVRTLPELLRLAPNLFVAQSNASQWAVNARGFVRTNAYSSKLLVMVDGRTVYSPFFSNVFWDSTDVFLPDLERVEVISGPNGASWGANAVNGVISVVTRSAAETKGALVYGGGGTDDTQAGVRYGAAFGENGAFRIYAKRTAMDSTRTASGADALDSWNLAQAGFRADWSGGGGGALTLQGDVYRGRYDSGPVPDVRAHGANVLFRWERTLLSGAKAWLRFYHDYTMRDTSQFITERTNTTDVELQHRFMSGANHEFLWGLNYRLMHDEIADTIGFSILPADLTFGQGSVFAQHEMRMMDSRVRVTSGLRVENNYFSGWEWMPSVRVAWHPASAQTLWAAASRAARIPSRIDTGFFIPAAPPYVVAGGPDFGAELLDAYEIGWRTRLARTFSFTATAYFHDYDDLRSTELTSPIVIGNGVDGQSYGVELFADWEVTPVWRLRVGGFRNEQKTWLEPGSLDSERAQGEVSYPDFQVQFRNVFQLRPDLTLWTSLRRVGAVPAFENGISGEVPAYSEFDASLVWSISGQWELSLTGRNLLHGSHPEIGSDATRREIERNFSARVQWRY